MGDLTALLKASGREIEDSPVAAKYLGELIGLLIKAELTGKLAKDVLARMFEDQ